MNQVAYFSNAHQHTPQVELGLETKAEKEFLTEEQTRSIPPEEEEVEK